MLLISELSIKVDCGDYVIVTNSRNVKVTGKKDQQLLFRKHSMFPGGLKETPYRAMMVKKPDEVRFSLIALALVRPSTSLRHFMVASPRLYDMQCQACYPRINYENADWNACECSHRTIWVYWGLIF
jgi:hypothetical protein